MLQRCRERAGMPVVADGFRRQMNPQQGSLAFNLALDSLFRQDLLQPRVQPVPQSIDVGDFLGGQVMHGGKPGGHGNRIPVEGASMINGVGRGGTVLLHDVGSAAEGAYREATPYDLGEGRQIRLDGIEGLGAPAVQAERLHLIQDQQDVMGGGDLADGLQIVRCSCDHAMGSQQRFHEASASGGEMLTLTASWVPW